MPSPHSVLAVTAVCSLVAPAAAQLGWQQYPGSHPSARHEAALSADPTGGGLVLFGGSSNSGLLADTWRWTGAQWLSLAPANSPPARYGARMASDTARGVVVLFGGFLENYNLPNPIVPLGDTWEWDGTDWNQRVPTGSPSPRWGHAMAYDSLRGRTVLFGGTDATNPWLADTWEWDGNHWRLRPTPTPVPGQVNHSMAFDAARGVCVRTDGLVLAARATWEWNGVAWRKAGAMPAASTPCFGGRMVYDEARRRVVWYGGADNNGNALPIGVWEWDGQDWTPRTTATAPPHRYWHMLAYDPASGETIAFGGRDDSQPALQQRKSDTWRLAPVYPASTMAFGTGCAGSLGVLSIDSVDRPWLGTTFHVDWTNTPPASVVVLVLGWSSQVWSGTPLPLALGAIGMTGCSLFAAVDHATPLASAGGALQQDLVLPNVPAVLGLDLFLQGFGFDATANPAGLTASNGLALRLGGL
ncbi:MAG TPA: hypothetical protein VFZ65_09240 [Planctomycetota bacterium]|nr:hypothetical protein [Planctomycetota bacterium]